MPRTRPEEVVPDQDLDWDRRELVVHRIGLVLLIAIVTAALLGGFGRGVLARRSLGSDGLRIAYERIVRQGLSSEIQVSAEGGFSTLVLDRTLVAHMEQFDFTPLPSASRLLADGLHLDFDPPTDSLRVSFTPVAPGSFDGSIQVDGRSTELTMFVLP
ncbi:MAG: hypothetical protein ACLGH3_10185 [Actinomycetota bacterium]